MVEEPICRRCGWADYSRIDNSRQVFFDAPLRTTKARRGPAIHHWSYRGLEKAPNFRAARQGMEFVHCRGCRRLLSPQQRYVAIEISYNLEWSNKSTKNMRIAQVCEVTGWPDAWRTRVSGKGKLRLTAKFTRDTGLPLRGLRDCLQAQGLAVA